MIEIQVQVEGVSPLIVHRFTDAAALRSTSGTQSSAAAREQQAPADEAEQYLYLGLDGKPVIPQPNLLRCIVDGGRFHKAGKKQITTAKESLLYGCLDIEGADIPIVHRQPWRVDTRAVRIPATGGRILRHRPAFDDWRLRFTARLDETILSIQLLRNIVDDAGVRIGLGDFRPSTKGPYGRFKVTLWEVAEGRAAA